MTRVNRPAPILPSGHSSRNRFGLCSTRHTTGSESVPTVCRVVVGHCGTRARVDQSAATHGRWWPINRNEARHHTTTRAYAEQATGITGSRPRALQYFLVCVRRRAETNLPDRSRAARQAAQPSMPTATRDTAAPCMSSRLLPRFRARGQGRRCFYAPCAVSGRCRSRKCQASSM
jgi:hypothetical protein